ncbi:cytochrome c [Mucilaginibacter pallidiroseus]|uniref:Cytochrome c n=1 Tax=Mucilaginibacter pallidiroseus TaxID=2599295 RepID=A0A563UJ49_9SPHI|nr:cytochrome c [Mucilaginibacter pallidiroseus]TWR31339.1 cytochrome c [Mucilaginibacter pallidiroseus]
MKFKVIALLVAFISLIAACKSDEQQEFMRYYNGGNLLYKQHCQNCHGAQGQGLSQLIPPLTDSVYLKTNREKLSCLVNYGIEENVVVINKKAYQGSMPATDLPPVDIAKVLTYINNSFGNKLGLINVETVEKHLAACK